MRIAHERRDRAVGHDAADQHERLHDAIRRHIQAHPHAADTAAGILACWVPPRGLEGAAEHLAAVLDRLVAEGVLRAQPLPDGNTLYRRGDAAGPTT